MNNFIKLHLDNDNSEVYINFDLVTDICITYNVSKLIVTRINLINKDWIDVIETPNEVLEKIKEQKNELS